MGCQLAARGAFARLAIAATVACGAGLAAAPASAQTAKVQVGILACQVAPSVGFVIGSLREMTCELRTAQVQPYQVKSTYKGTVARFGVDIGIIAANTLAWAVFAPSVAVGPADLAGTYLGVSADAAWALGGGVNVLLGGSNNSIALQPLSVEGIAGADLAAGVADLTLTPVAK